MKINTKHEIEIDGSTRAADLMNVFDELVDAEKATVCVVVTEEQFSTFTYLVVSESREVTR